MTDITAITTPFGLLDRETQDALRAWPHGWEHYSHDGWEIATPLWNGQFTYRAKPAPVMGQRVYNGSLHDYYSMFPDTAPYRNDDKPARVTFSTINSLLIPGTYTGPNGATITIEALK